MLTTFQLFRLQYSRLFNSPALSCTLELKDKFYVKLNRYSLIQLTFVYLPIIAANTYNLWWTWSGRQVFWIDIESLGTSGFRKGACDDWRHDVQKVEFMKQFWQG